MSSPPSSSTKPYLIRAIFEWCVDQGFTPYVAVAVDNRTEVPRNFVRDKQIVLNLSPDAVHQLVLGNEFLTCSARFGGVAQSISVPVENVSAVYARENGQGMVFDLEPPVPADDEELQDDGGPSDEPPRPSGRPSLKVVK